MNIKASDVASIIGKNPYKTCDEVFNERIRLYFNANVDTPDTLFIKSLETKAPDVQRIVRDTISRSKSEVLSPQKDIENVPEDLKEYVKHEIYKNNGTINEAITAKNFNVQKDPKRYSLNIYRDVRLVGFIDGKVKDGTLVEIKNRQNRLFGRVADYEAIQCQVYMKLTDVHKCTLIEQFQNSTNTFQLEFDETRWNTEIFPALVKFAKRLVEFQNSEDPPEDHDSL